MVELAVSPVRAQERTDELVIAPVNRVGGGLDLRVNVDPQTNRYSDARCAPVRFRGYESLLAGRDVRDAIYIASRCCGYHGGQHAIAAAQAVEMALGLEPPPMAVCLRNLGLSAEIIHAEAAHLFLLAGPDFSAAAFAEHFPEVLALAQRTPAAHADVHGFATVGDIMRSLDPITGRWYRDAFSVARIPYEMYSVLHGKYPHPQTIVPGGVGTQMSNTTVSSVHDYVVRLLSLVDPAKRVAMLITDLLDFLVSAVPEISEIGVGPQNFIDSGLWDDPEGYDPSWEGLSARGDRRWASPGVILDGKLVTADLREVADGIQEDVNRSFYKPTDSAEHPFDRRTVAAPAAIDWNGHYSWATSATWKGEIVETGPGARLWTTALRGTMQPNPFVGAHGGAVQLALPEAAMPEMVLEWRPPKVWNAIERTRARLYGVVFAALVAAQQSLKLFDLQKEGRHETAVRFDPPKPKGQHRGVGFAGDGLLGHWMTLEKRYIERYQVVAPSTFNLGPGGPAEAAVNDTPILEQSARPSGIEALIALRSLDPCTNCATH